MNDEAPFGIRPEYFYRLSAPETLRIVGLGLSGIDDAIARGELPPVVTLTPSGRFKGWRGIQLIQMIKDQLAAAGVTLPVDSPTAPVIPAVRPLPKAKKIKPPPPPPRGNRLPHDYRLLLHLTAEDIERAHRLEDPKLAAAFEHMMQLCVRTRVAAGIKYAKGRPRLQLEEEVG